MHKSQLILYRFYAIIEKNIIKFLGITIVDNRLNRGIAKYVRPITNIIFINKLRWGLLAVIKDTARNPK